MPHDISQTLPDLPPEKFLDRGWSFRLIFPWLGRSEDNEGLEVHGRAESVYHQAR